MREKGVAMMYVAMKSKSAITFSSAKASVRVFAC